MNATFDGVPYRGSLVTYGAGHMILVLTSIQKQIGKMPGDTVRVTIALDEAPRVVELDADVASAFADAKVEDAFRAMWITDAKREDTRARRITKSVELIRDGVRLKG